MSNRDSLGVGELLPQDVVDIFSQEKQEKKSSKKRSRSLGRALGWLKGKKKKNLGNNGKNLSLGPALDLALNVHSVGHKGGLRSGIKAHPHGNSHANAKQDDDRTPAPPLLQENVFIESSRPKYLEDLHTEAMEGLKMMQEEETNIRGEYDTESIISSLTVQTDGEGAGFMTDSTIPDSSSVISTRSSVSTKSSRSGLTRQASTFRPLNSGKKSKSKKRDRKAAAGIPRHVQRELGLDRVGWTLDHKLEEDQLYDGESDYSSTSPTSPTSPTAISPQQDSPEGACPSLQCVNALHPLSEEKIRVLNTTHASHSDDLALLRSLNPDLAGEQRPRSLAVPWLTSTSEPPSPVMSMSPQAAYMSKIIPNAVLPPSIDVVEISRGRSRNSVRTVSKSSLVLASPAPSRASSVASSTRTISSQVSNMRSASRQNHVNMSDCSWNTSDSSETLVSDSSTISNTSARQKKYWGVEATSANNDEVCAMKSASNGKLISDGDDGKKDGQFGRSLSVIKPKRAPPPPSRTYSLHTKMKRRSRDLTDVRVIVGKPSSPTVTTQGGGIDNNKPRSSPMLHGIVENPRNTLDANSSQVHREKNMINIISPSSGYSNQDGISPQASKKSSGSSGKPRKGFLAKFQMLFPGSSSAHSNQFPSKEAKPDLCDRASVSPSVQTLMELFNIPPHPKVRAPPPPPPEVWAYSKRSFELLLGPPAPDNLYAIIKKNPKDRRQQRVSPPVSAESSVKSLIGERISKSSTVESAIGSVQMLETKKVEEIGILITEIHKEDNERLAQNDLNVCSSEVKMRGSDILHGMLAKAVEKRKERLVAKKEDEIKVSTDPLSAISLVRNSPSQSPSLGRHPVPGLLTQTKVVVTSEPSWPPPPPPIAPVNASGPDELELPFPPPPVEGLVLPGQMPPAKSDSVVITRSVHVIQGADSQTLITSQEEASPPLNIPPPPSYAAPLPPTSAASLPTVTMIPPPSSKDVSPQPPTHPPPTEEFSLRAKGSPVTVVHISPPLVIEAAPLPPEHIPPPPPQEISTDEAKPVSMLSPPQSIPAPPPLILLRHSLKTGSESEVSQPSALKTSLPERAQETILASPVNIPIPPPLPINQPRAMSPKKQSQEQASSAVIKDESPTHIITTSLLQMVKLRSVNSSPEPPKAQEPPQTEVSLPKQEPDYQVHASPAHGEAPQKPIRRSLIMTSPTFPTSTSPPAVVASIPTSPESQTVVIQSESSSTTITLMEKASDTTVSPSVVSSSVSYPVVSIVETSLTTTVSPVVTPPVSTSTDDHVDEKSTTVSPSGVTISTVISSVEAISSETVTSPSVLTPTVSSVTVVSSVESSPAPLIEAPPTSTPIVISTEENSAPSSSSIAVASSDSSSTVTSIVEKCCASTVSSVVTPTVSSSIDASTVEESPPKAVSISVVTTSESSSPEEKSLATTPAPSVVIPPTSLVPVISTVDKPVSTAPPKIVVSPTTSTTVVKSPTKTSVTPPVTSPVKKSATTAPAASMKLQEAIRLRTVARSKESPSSRLNLHSLTSPKDFCKSPTNTASFIFAKSTKKVVIETKPISKAKEDKQQTSSFAKVIGEAESQKKGLKVPPQVAKKPKEKEVEKSKVTEQTAGQEAHQETIKDDREKTNRTAGTVEGGAT
ncbi:uncharacterized protein KIAA1522 homolog [Gouania willdenowi]|uniref:Uncharacterized protein n=1 Tax=Gouania willdenowi TaxID=441366 RepID=A0A8C5GTD9_GOUWI|nr:uncharacterized protein KIAA1522 homolog [Gouania willdenowi]XP_028293991.1 uncharacterized protein KIAA1522 homolog [Gouania willdenowi]XP_028293992.1 uncharacterized protein KIAA1522 homolog [Gouania willdenowi]